MSAVCALQCPCRGCLGTGWCPLLLSVDLSTPRAQSSGRHRNGPSVHFRITTLIDILQQMGSEWRVCAFPCGGNVCPLGEGKNHMGGVRVLESPTWEHVWTSGGGVCPEVSA